MTLCNGCGRVIGAHVDPHVFGANDRYHPGCCPMCTPDLQPSEAQLVSMAKRGHRRGTPRAWALRGAGG